MIELKTILQQINEDDQPVDTPTICYYPGGFKPPHKGHYEVVKDLASRNNVTKVIVLIGHKERDGITKEMSLKIWDLYQQIQPISKLIIRIADNESPVKDVFSLMDDDLKLKAKVAGIGGEEGVQGYFDSLKKAFGERITTVPVEEKVVVQGKRASGTQTREYINKLKEVTAKLQSIPDKESTEYSKTRNEYLNTLKTVQGFFPDFVTQKGKFDDILNILGIPVLDEENLQEFKLDVKPTVNIKNVDKEELKKGIKVEKEHTSDIKTATRIALDHLSEDPKYYSKLAKADLEENLFTITWWRQTLKEEENEVDVVDDFIKFAIETLELQKVPKITFVDDPEVAKNMHSLGAYNTGTDELLIVKSNRLTADILRTLAHELVHLKQDELGMIEPDSGKTGSPVENEANAAAGILLRQFGKYRPEIFEKLTEGEEKQYKIYCDMDGVLVDFEKGYKDLTGTEASYSTDPNEFWEPITKAGAGFWIRLKWMPDGKELWDYIKPYNPELLSAPSREESSRIGKFTWVKRNTPGTKLILRSADRKQEFATPDAILIDDRADNIQRWIDAGGIGIHHISAENTIKQLQELGL
jgi:hypothetical protein